MYFMKLNFIFKDIAEYSQMYFQDVASHMSENLIFFHDNIMFIVMFMTIFVLWFMFSSILNKNYYKFLLSGVIMEIMWTIIPAGILLFMAFPSLHLLYNLDENTNPFLTMKAVGHQWYWSYEYSDFLEKNMEFDSYMLSYNDLKKGDLSLLEVDNKIKMPMNSDISVVCTGADVIHCFTIPSLGMKMDSIPGSLNQINFNLKSPGIFYGQCSEMCGSDHSFMPIVIESLSQENFIEWILDKE